MPVYTGYLTFGLGFENFFFLSRFGNIHDLLADALMGFYNQDPSVLCVKENWKMGLTEFVERV